MPSYRVRAIDAAGTAVDTVAEGASRIAVAEDFRLRGYTVNSIREVEPPRALPWRTQRLSWRELHLFCEQLHTLAAGGYPLTKGLKDLARDIRDPKIEKVFEEIRDGLDRGASLSDCFARHADRFPRFVPSLIRAGEVSGNLPGVLQLLCGHVRGIAESRERLKSMLAYPALLGVACIATILLLLLRVVPEFKHFFSSFAIRMPAPTKVLFTLSDALNAHLNQLGIAVFVFVAMLVMVYFLLRATSRGRYALDVVRLFAPITGRIDYLRVLVHYSRALSLLLYARVPVGDALELAALAADSPFLERAAETAGNAIANGETLAEAHRRTRCFGHDFCWLLALGEQRGHAEESLEHLAEYYTIEAENRRKLFASLFEPVTIILVGSLVGFVVVSLYIPIFQVGEKLNR